MCEFFTHWSDTIHHSLSRSSPPIPLEVGRDMNSHGYGFNVEAGLKLPMALLSLLTNNAL